MSIDDLFNTKRTMAEWENLLGRMTEREFLIALSQVIQSEKIASLEMMLAMARKLSQHAHFSEGLNEEQRKDYSSQAQMIVQYLAEVANENTKTAILKAWADQESINARFGYLSGGIWDAMRPHIVFSDHTDE